MFPRSYIFFVSFFFHLSMYMLSFFSVVWIHFPFVAFLNGIGKENGQKIALCVENRTLGHYANSGIWVYECKGTAEVCGKKGVKAGHPRTQS